MSVGGKTHCLCVGGGGGAGEGGGLKSRWREEGRRGVLGFGEGRMEGGGGVRIAGCGWVCQCHVSRLAPLASRLEDVGARVWLSLSGFSSQPKVGVSAALCCILLAP